jgi:N-acetylglucosaminyl-diphospho-decaprenol L-rhamnosyltransferase
MRELTAIVVSYNTRDLLRPCLTELSRHLAGREAELVVVDNASSDGSAAMVARAFPQVRLLANGDNVGFAGANNLALAATQSRYVLLLNSDAFLEEGALETMLSVLRLDSRIAVVAPRLHDQDGEALASAHAFESVSRLALATLNAHRLLPRPALLALGARLGRAGAQHLVNYTAGPPVDVDWVSGACMLVRRTAIAEVGGLDPGYFMYMEDEDWCRRFAQAGYRVVYVPQAQCAHWIAQSSPSTRRRAGVYRASRLRYHRQYHRAWYPIFWVLATACLLREWCAPGPGRPRGRRAPVRPQEAPCDSR